MEQWVVLRKGADFEVIGEKFNISPRLACLVRNRDIVGEDAIGNYLHGTIADLHDGMLMRDMDKAVEILMEKICGKEKIRVIGDYDIDGVNATYILLEGLEHLGGDVDVDIPNRITDGYGLNRDLIDRAFADGVDTIVTCDNGIAAGAEIAYGKDLGMTIIVTDHHEVPYESDDERSAHKDGNGEDINGEDGSGARRYILPPADAVVDPKREDCDYPFDGLCGAAVAYKLVEALYEAMGHDAEDMDYLMEQVAIATVGDVMDLVGENRIFVKQGLEMMKRTANKGLQSLMTCTGVEPQKLAAYHIGFVIGPCMNAGGRLDTARRTLDLLRADTKREADILAGDLKSLNDSRKSMTETALQDAFRQVESGGIKDDKVLVIYLPDCHESLAGIVAGRIREKYYKPAFVLTDADSGVKGSGRSIEAYHMYEELSKCRELLSRFGGHKLAAGLSLERKNVELFRREINDVCLLEEKDFREKVIIDMQMPFAAITEELVREITLLEPFGKGNTRPVFAEKNVELLRAQILGKRQNVLKFLVRDSQGTEMDALYFGDGAVCKEYMREVYGKERTDDLFKGRSTGITMSVTYYPQVNEYLGTKTLQIVITHYQ